MSGWLDRERAAVPLIAEGATRWGRAAFVVWLAMAPAATLVLWVVLPAGLPGRLGLLSTWLLGAPVGLLAAVGLPAGPRTTLAAAATLWALSTAGGAWILQWPAESVLVVAAAPLSVAVLTWPRLLRRLLLGPRARGWSLPPASVLRQAECPPHLARLLEAVMPATDGDETESRPLVAAADADATLGAAVVRPGGTPLEHRARALRERARRRNADTAASVALGDDPVAAARKAGDSLLAYRLLAATRPWMLAEHVTEDPMLVAEALAWEAPSLLVLWALGTPRARPQPAMPRDLPVPGGVTALQRGMAPYPPYLGTGDGSFKVLSRETGWSLAHIGRDEAGLAITAIDAEPVAVRVAYGRADGVVGLMRVVGGQVVGEGREVAAAPITAVQFVPGRPWLAAAAASGWLQVMALDEAGLPVRFRQQPAPGLARMVWRLLADGPAAWLLGPGSLRWLRPEQGRTPVSGDFAPDWRPLAIEPVSGWWVLGQAGEARGYGPLGGDPEWRLRGNGEPVDAAFGRGGDWLATVWDSGEVRVHDLAHRSLLAIHRVEALSGPVAFVEEDRMVAVGTTSALVLLPVRSLAP
ncbi:MAG: hypothetical protein FJY99_01495 [Candidatus Sericytochromatia bacterium]|nr:hypothetical protein [Candidatus Tanganyikabacteria bacterium]